MQIGVAAQAIIAQFIYTKMPPHLKKSINHAQLENVTYEQIVTHLEEEVELDSLEAPDELQMNTETQKLQTESNKDNAGNNKTDANNSNSNINKHYRHSKIARFPLEHVETQTMPQRIDTMEPKQQTGYSSGRAHRQCGTDLSNSTNRAIKPRM